MPLPRGRFMSICIEISSHVFEVQRSQVGNRRTNGQTDRQTDGQTDKRADEGTQVENVIPPASLDWRADKYSGERKKVGIEVRKVRAIGMHEKIAPKRNRFGIGDAPWELPLPLRVVLCHTF